MADTTPLAPTDAEIDALDDQLRWDTTEGRRAFARAVLAKWGAQPVAPAGYALVPVEPTYVNIQQRCAEVMEWRRTGILRGNALREYSKEHWAGYTHDLQLAEQETAAQAMTVIAKLVAQPVVRDPLTDEAARKLAFTASEWCRSEGISVEDAVEVVRATERAHGIT